MTTLMVTVKDRDENLGTQPCFLLPCLSGTYYYLITFPLSTCKQRKEFKKVGTPAWKRIMWSNKLYCYFLCHYLSDRFGQNKFSS